MTRILHLTGFVCFFSLWTVAQVPDTINWQGFLADASGPIDGPVDLVIRLYETSTGGTHVYEKVATVTAEEGIVNVPLGPFPGVSFGVPLYVGVNINGEGELTPRLDMRSVPYALSMRGMRVDLADNGTSVGVNVIGGAANNAVGSSVVGAVIGGGGGNADGELAPNQVLDDFGTIGGRYRNGAGDGTGS